MVAGLKREKGYQRYLTKLMDSMIPGNRFPAAIGVVAAEVRRPLQ